MRRKKIVGLFIIILISVSTLFIVQNHPDENIDYLKLSNKELNEMAKYDRPDLADLHNFEMTKDPSLGYPPTHRLFKAKDYTNRLMRSVRASSPGSWVERGPNNFGGRTRAIMFDPNDPFSKKVWAAGVGGGLWYNNDITNVYSSWYAIDDFFGNIAINSIAFDPNDTDVFYFGTGEGWGNADAARGNGIWKTTDGGDNWSQISSTADNDQFYYVQKIAVTNESTVLAATRNSGGILRSTDGGTTWDRVIEESRGADIEIVGDIIYASTGVSSTTGKLWKSTDDGLTWDEITPMTGMNRIEIGVNENHPNTIYVVMAQGSNVGGFFRSFDAGNSWSSITIPPYTEQSCDPSSSSDFTRGQAWYDLIIAVDPTDKNTLIVGGIDLNKSTDGGSSWDLISYWTGGCDDYVHADQHNFLFRPGYPDYAIAATDGGIYYTETFSRSIEDGGPLFYPRNKDYNVAQFYSCALINEKGQNYFMAGAQDNGSHQFFDAGVNSTNEITGGDGAFCFIDQDDSDIQITSFVYNSYWITRDGWNSNARVEFGSSVGRFINPADYANTDDILYAAGDNNQLIRYNIPSSGTIEAEDLSISLDGDDISAITVSDYDNDILIVGTDKGGVYKVTNASTTPSSTKISNSTIPDDVYISSIDIGSDNDHLLITASNYGIESVFLTTDGGTNWVSKEGNLPDMPIRWALFNPSDREEVLLATELGVWMTSAISDSSPTWEVANDGLANVRCDMLQIRSSDGLVGVATHGRGLYTSDIWATESTADFTSLDLAYEGADLNFLDASISASSYLWSFGDGGSSTDQNPTYSYSVPGSYTVTLQINGDSELEVSKDITVLPALSVDYDLADGGNFDVNTSHFEAITIAGTGFELGSSSITGKSGTNSGANAWVTDLDGSTYEANSEAYLYSPVFDFSLSGDYTIEFFTKYEIEDEWEGFTIEYSTDYGMNWYKLGDFLDEDNWYNQTALASAVVWTPGEFFFSGDTDNDFEKKSITTNELSNEEAVSFRFVFKSDPGTEEAGIAIDDFTIVAPTETTPNVTMSTVEDICLGDVIVFENESTGDITSYSWDFGSGAIPATATGFGPHEVYYSTSGVKSVELVGSTGGGDVNVSQEIEVFALPESPVIEDDEFELCAQDEAVVSVTNSQSGISYTLYNVSSKETVGSSIDGNDGEISLSTGAISAGQYEYRVIAENANGCQSLGDLITVDALENPPVVIIKLSSKVLKASPGDSYQWYLDGEEIQGATEIELSISEIGDYTVEVTFGNCISVSEVFTVTSVLGFSDDNQLLIYPNPSVKSFKILNISDVLSVSAFGIDGKRYDLKRSEDSFDISFLKTGVYTIRIETKGGSINTKLVKR